MEKYTEKYAAEQRPVPMTGNAAAVGISVPSRQSFGEIWGSVRTQVEFDCFAHAERAEADALCRIIAEMLLLGGNGTIRIAGDEIPADAVRDIFASLTHEHLVFVLDNLSRGAVQIKSKKAYLRACLYNSFFELEEQYANFARVALGGGK